MTTSKLQINRPLTGLIALALLIAGVVVLAALPQSPQIAAGCIRSGLVLGALWLALPTRTRPAAWEDVSWTTFVAILLVIVAILSARLRWWGIPVLLALAFAFYFLRRVAKKR